MAERDKVIKSGQLTLPRILFLVVVGGLIFSTVYAGRNISQHRLLAADPCDLRIAPSYCHGLWHQDGQGRPYRARRTRICGG